MIGLIDCDPIAVKAVWHSHRQMYDGHWLISERPAINDGEFGEIGLVIVPQGHDPAVVLGGVQRSRNKHRLAISESCPVIANLRGSGFKIMFDEHILRKTGADTGAIPVTVVLSYATFINPRKLLWSIIELLMFRSTCYWIEYPLIKCWWSFTRSAQFRRKHSIMAHRGQHNGTVRSVVRVHRMKDVTRIYFTPSDVPSRTFARQQTDSSLIHVVPVVRKCYAAHRHIEIEHARQIKNQHVFFAEPRLRRSQLDIAPDSPIPTSRP